MKSLTLICILAASLLLVSVLVQANDVTWGHIGRYDRLLATDHVQKPGRILSKQTVTVVYPPKGHISYATLTAIRVLDKGGRKEFGYATLQKGGPGHRVATIFLKSQRGRGLNFTIQYYGH